MVAHTPILIAHRGASADRPEHTLAAYHLAIEQGADFIEPDLVSTKDGHLVARHENEIGGTTDVALRPEFASRKTRKLIDGQLISGWFTEDFTLAELKTLRAVERLPELRPANRKFDGQEEIPTLHEIIQIVKKVEQHTGKKVGIYPETKHPGYFRAIGLPLEERLLDALKANGYAARNSPVFIQSFEVENLRYLRKMTSICLVQLMSADGGPADIPDKSYIQMVSPEGLREISAYADAIGVERDLVIPRDTDGQLGKSGPLVRDAHAAGLQVHVWTFRPENHFLPTEFRSDASPFARGDMKKEIRKFLDAGIDGLFSDSVIEARTAIDVMN